MENNKNIFGKLDTQGEKIENISQKLDGISIDNLYLLAKRTWDYGDYETAQKYYNHISLLNPLDWEAPLYASLCKFNGYFPVYQYENFPEQLQKIMLATIKYIEELSINDEVKEKQIEKCLEVIKEELCNKKEIYKKNRKLLDECASNYIISFEELLLNIYNEFKKIQFECVSVFCSDIVDYLFELIELTSKVTHDMTEELFNEMKKQSTKKYNIEINKLLSSTNCVNSFNDLSEEEINHIKTEGKMYYYFNDVSLARSISKKRLAFGIFFLFSSIVGIYLSIFGKWYWLFLFVYVFLYGIVLIYRGKEEKEKVNCSSFLASIRKKKTYTKSSNVIKKDKFKFIDFIFGRMGLYFMIYFSFLTAIFAFDLENKYIGISYALLAVLILIINLILLFIKTPSGRYIYYHNGKYYDFKE